MTAKHTAHPSPRPAPSYAAAAEHAIAWCLEHLHLDYVLGGEATAIHPDLDCSGMTKMAWKAAVPGGVELGGWNRPAHGDLYHYAAFQWWETAPVWRNHIGWLRRGDLVYYYWNPNKRGPSGQIGGPDHVALYLGWYRCTRWVVQATQPGTPSEVIPMRAYADPCGYGRVRFADWNHAVHEKAIYRGHGIDRTKFARYL